MKTKKSISAITRMCRDRMDKQRTMDFHLMSRMNRFVDRVTHLHDSQLTMKKVGSYPRPEMTRKLDLISLLRRPGTLESLFQKFFRSSEDHLKDCQISLNEQLTHEQD